MFEGRIIMTARVMTPELPKARVLQRVKDCCPGTEENSQYFRIGPQFFLKKKSSKKKRTRPAADTLTVE